MVYFNKFSDSTSVELNISWKKDESYKKNVKGYRLEKYTRKLGRGELISRAIAIVIKIIPSMLCNYGKPSKDVCRLWKQVFITGTESIRFGFKITDGAPPAKLEREKKELEKMKVEEGKRSNDVWKAIKRTIPSSLQSSTTTLKDLVDGPLEYEKGWEALNEETKSEIGDIHHLKGDYSTNTALGNKSKNRYGNILPYDGKLPKGDYVNASKIEYHELRRIAAQGPIGPNEGRGKGTVGDFLSMVHQQKATILCLTNHVEGNRTKCAHYWKPGITTQISEGLWCQVSNETRTIAEKGDQKLVEYTLNIVDEAEKIQGTIRMIHYENWRDHTPPDIELVQLLKEEISPEELVVTHCSAGIGRTGTFTAIECLCKDIDDQLEAGVPLEEVKINIPNTILELRRQRFGMVQTEEQYAAIVDFVIQYYKDKAAG